MSVACGKRRLWVQWDEVVPPNTWIDVRVRAGSTSVVDQTWGQFSQWASDSPHDLSYVKELPRGQTNYLQVEFRLQPGSQTMLPVLKSFDVAFECDRG